MNKTCESCSWWGHNAPNDTTGRRFCTHQANGMWSQDVKRPDGAVPAHLRDGAIVSFSPLYTGPQFGCIHHEPR